MAASFLWTESNSKQLALYGAAGDTNDTTFVAIVETAAVACLPNRLLCRRTKASKSFLNNPGIKEELKYV